MLASPGRALACRYRAAALSTRPRPRPAEISRVDWRAGTARISSMAASPVGKEERVAGEDEEEGGGRERAVSLEEWRAWGTSSPVPAMVAQVIQDLEALERDADVPMAFGGFGGKLQGNFKVQEDKKHRAVYESLINSEKKLQFFSARQIACRVLGSRGYLCQKCWLAMEDCMCSKLAPCSLWREIRFWLYMHPKDFLRQNNTGKLLWQIFGIQFASLCLFGVHEHEDIMWDAFKSSVNDLKAFVSSGKSMVWFLYPNKNASVKSVKDVFINKSFTSAKDQTTDLIEKPLNFVLIDGTWSNSAAMYNRLKERWSSVWGEEGEEGLPCISLSSLGASVMHKLRPQPAWDRTCTAAAAAALLLELHQLPELGSHGLDTQAEAVENALDVLLEALTTRRLRMGRSITRKARKSALFRQ